MSYFAPPCRQRLQIHIQGVVQGVGFRPFVYRLARDLALGGWVCNSGAGVEIEVEGEPDAIAVFLARLTTDKPTAAQVWDCQSQLISIMGATEFRIIPSREGTTTAWLLPDRATCQNCLGDIFDPLNARYRYPFTNCTNCGPRASAIESLPYDRPQTTMKIFPMCDRCQQEYTDPLDRRFHAQPNACPDCGPHLELWDRSGECLARHDRALNLAIAAIKAGKILAIKGLGGFHLMVDASNERAIGELRQRKHRPAKPFALMYPSLTRVKMDCEVSDLEETLLNSSAAPIVLLRRKTADSQGNLLGVAPHNPYLGVMLPYTPLHHLLMADLELPIVATSGNKSGEPICIDEGEALERLGAIADLFLVHNRPIAQPIDDSVVRIVAGKTQILRRARGYAPLPITLSSVEVPPILAMGAHLKNTIALSIGQEVLVSQQIGDLDTLLAIEYYRHTIDHYQRIYNFQPVAIACDLHPDYRSSEIAQELVTNTHIPLIPIQHHYAHSLACMAEHQLTGNALGIAWDGMGYGLDKTLWGGEFLQITPTGWQRVAHFRPFQLPGGEKAMKEPRRSALGLLFAFDRLLSMPELPPLQSFTPSELRILTTMLDRGINSPLTSSVGRLFDAIASLTGLQQIASFEGQAALHLEFALQPNCNAQYYPFHLHTANTPIIIDWEPMVTAILDDIATGESIAQISAKFHHALIEIAIAIAKIIGERTVLLTGGCWQNKYLTERAIIRFTAEDFILYYHQQIPPNDSGISLGQIVAAQRSPPVSIPARDY